MTRRSQEGWRDYFYVLCDYNDGGCGACGQWNHYANECIDAWNTRKGFTPTEVEFKIVARGQKDNRFKLGETIRYSPSEVRKILTDEY